MIDTESVQVIGLENGGVALECLDCDSEFAQGGCDCCTDNTVTLKQLIDASEYHVCDVK